MQPVFTPTDFVAVVNQTFEYAYPSVWIEGELAELRISKNKWVYFKLVDETASVSFFGLVYLLPGPLQNGLRLRVVGSPRLHPKYGFSVNFRQIMPVGQGSIKKAADLLAAKLQAEGLLAGKRKRPLPQAPSKVGLVTSAGSAAAADFMKVLNDRWAGVRVKLLDCLVQGENAPAQIIQAIEHFNNLPELPEVLAIVRGGGSAEDLASFNDERVVRAVAASRVPTVVAIGHEVDLSLAELAADSRASTPSLAAARLFPDKNQYLAGLEASLSNLKINCQQMLRDSRAKSSHSVQLLHRLASQLLRSNAAKLNSASQVVAAYNPANVLKRGYALVSRSGKYISSSKLVHGGDQLQIQMSDGKIKAKAQ